jgi:hypothetical protein
MQSRNKTFLAKLGCKILKEEELMWVKALKGKYIKNKIKAF